MNSRQNWDSSPHQKLYDQIHGKGNFFVPDGAGVSGAADAQNGWGKLGALMADARDRTEATLAKAGAEWEGDAAYAMRSGVTPLAQWADDAHVAGTASQSSTDGHVGSYAAAKNEMPEPVPVTSTANSDFAGIPAGFTHLFGGQTDQDKQEAAAQEAKAEAVRIMTGYEDESLDARASVGQFVPPPSVTVSVASTTQPTGGDVIQVGDSAVREPGQTVEDSTRSASDTRGPGTTPPPVGTAAPPSSGNASEPQSTAPSAFTPTPTPSLPPNSLPTPGPTPDQVRPGVPVVPLGGVTTGGPPGERVAGGGGRGPAGRGFGGGVGEGTGRGPAGAGPGPGGARGAVPGVGGLANETVTGRTGAAGARGAGGMGMAPAGGRADGEEDKEHKTAEYLQGTNDSFWDDSPPVAPAVIGDEDDD